MSCEAYAARSRPLQAAKLYCKSDPPFGHCWWPLDSIPECILQIAFQGPLREGEAEGLRVEKFPADRFPAGQKFFKHPSEEDYAHIHFENIVVVHNNWIKGHDKKRHRFQEYQLWDVGDRVFPCCTSPARMVPNCAVASSDLNAAAKVIGPILLTMLGMLLVWNGHRLRRLELSRTGCTCGARFRHEKKADLRNICCW